MAISTDFNSSSSSASVLVFATDTSTGKITSLEKVGSRYYRLSDQTEYILGFNEVITIGKPQLVSLGQESVIVNSTTPDALTNLIFTQNSLSVIPTYAAYASILVTKAPIIFSATGSDPDPVAETGSGKVPKGGKILLQSRYEIQNMVVALLDNSTNSTLTIDYFNTCCGWGHE